ncbi:hypothetical protein [Bifidobacterium olomucense]|nr:hypothetical protein [Bifidobacterium sp. DSM 109959]
MSPCEQALTLVNDDSWNGTGTPMTVRYVAGQSVPLAWIDVAASCPGRFGEGVLRNAQSKAKLASLAQRLSAVTPSSSPARLDGVTAMTMDTDVLDAMALAEDRAGFALEVLAAQGRTAGATLQLSDLHKSAGQQLVSLADGSWNTAGDTGASGTHADPRQKVYDISTLLANPVTIDDKPSGQTVPTAAAIEMDCARAEIKAVTDSDSPSDTTTLSILAALAAKHAYAAFQLGYPTADADLFER